MKSFKKMRRLLNDRGIAVILVAGILVTFLLLFMVVGIEFARMYYTRGQLQNAADSAALAGAQRITDPTDTTQTDARDAAVAFAARNKAGNIDVRLANDGVSNTTWPDNLSNDIAVGHWSETAETCPTTSESANFCPGETPVNAVKVVAQRASGLETADASTSRGPVEFLFKGIGNLVGWNQMDIRRQAIAARLSRADTYITTCYKAPNGICEDEAAGSCIYPNSCNLTSVRFLIKDGTGPLYRDDMAWTSLSSNTSSSDVGALLCGEQPLKELCGSPVTTSAGNESSFATLESRMYNPSYDAANKTCGAVGGPYIEGSCAGSSAPVNGWWVEVPVVNWCPATDQPAGLPIWGYVRLHFVAVCGASAGSGNTCAKDYHAPTTPTDACGYYGNLYQLKYGNTGNNFAAIDGIECVDCAHKDYKPGPKAQLVK